jgi:RHS repeat-associated protein
LGGRVYAARAHASTLAAATTSACTRVKGVGSARARGCAGARYPFLTEKERDFETGLDYFGARYYASLQGRFTGVDPYDVNFERQNTADPEEASALLRNYISQPQHWNRFAYALNNPLRYVDPDGLLEYETELLGQTIKVKISDNLKSEDGEKLKGDDLKKAQEKIIGNINNAIAKINSDRSKLSSEEITIINSMKAIEVRTDIRTPGMNGSTFQMPQRYSETDDQETLVAAFIHESYHAYQRKRGGPSNRIEAEKQASAFTFPILEKFGMSYRII